MIERAPSDVDEPPAGRGDPWRFPQHASVTPREAQILDHVLSGLSQVEIAAREGIAISTVRMHVRNLHQKTRTRNLHSLAVWAIEHRDCCRAPSDR